MSFLVPRDVPPVLRDLKIQSRDDAQSFRVLASNESGVRVTITDADSTPTNTLIITGNPAITGDITHTGDLTVTGDLLVTGASTLTGGASKVTISSSHADANAIGLTGKTTITGATVVAAGASKASISSSHADADAIALTGKTTITGATVVAAGAGKASIASSHADADAIALTGKTTITGATVITGGAAKVSVASTHADADAIALTGKTTITGATVVTGAGTITAGAAKVALSSTHADADAIGLTGKTTITGATVIAGGAAKCSIASSHADADAISLTGNTTITGTATVTGLVSLTGDQVTRTLYPASTITYDLGTPTRVYGVVYGTHVDSQAAKLELSSTHADPDALWIHGKTTITGATVITGSASVSDIFTAPNLKMKTRSLTQADISVKNAFDLTTDVSTGYFVLTMGPDAAKVDAGWTIALPTPATNASRVLMLKLANTTGQTATFTGSGKMGLANDATALTVATAATLMTTFFCDGTTWFYVIGA